MEPRGLDHPRAGGEDAHVGLDDETDDPFRRLFRRGEQLAPEFALLTGTNSIFDEINSVEETDAQADGDDDPLGRLVRRGAAILDRWPGDGQPVTWYKSGAAAGTARAR